MLWAWDDGRVDRLPGRGRSPPSSSSGCCQGKLRSIELPGDPVPVPRGAHDLKTRIVEPLPTPQGWLEWLSTAGSPQMQQCYCFNSPMLRQIDEGFLMSALAKFPDKQYPSPIARTRYFDFYRVDGYPLIDDTYLLRYQVYCLERGFLPTDDYPGSSEADEFDHHAIHFLGQHRYKELSAGTARLVFCSDLGIPVVEHCAIDPDFKFLSDADNLQRYRYAEISRMAVSKVFRQRADDSKYGGPARGKIEPPHDVPEDELNPDSAGPEIVAGIYKCLYQEGKRRGLAGFLAAMERSLYVLLRRLSVRFSPIGPEVDYYGPVRPYILPIKQLEDDMLKRRPEVLRYWLMGLEPKFWPEQVKSLDELAKEKVDSQ